MDESIANKLKLLRDSIEASNYSLDNIREWGGADVIITKDVERIDPDWVKNQPIIISEQEGEPQRRIVVTEHAIELSWVFIQLRDIFGESIDFYNKYHFYGSLAQSALNVISQNEGKVELSKLLLKVVSSAENFFSKN